MDYNKAIVAIPKNHANVSSLKDNITRIITMFYITDKKISFESEVSSLKLISYGYSCEIIFKNLLENKYGISCRLELEFFTKSGIDSKDVVTSVHIWGANRPAIELLFETHELLIKEIHSGLEDCGIPSAVMTVIDQNEHFLNEMDEVFYLLNKNDVIAFIY